ncbi:MAG: pseudouridine synthase [Candidatus Pelethousia sp.]|nr:pseudouridine synthase [Candidatus Pelethousia sp.]
MRLQKFMADAGIASRRKCEEMILGGRVRLNGQPAQLGCSVNPPFDVVEVDGHAVHPEETRITVVLNKPRGVMCTASDPQGRPTVMHYVKDLPARVYNVGRLDYDSEGLLVMTNDGELAYRLTHPKFKFDKTYSAICNGALSAEEKSRLEQGVMLEDGITFPARVEELHHLQNGNTAFNITIHEGRNRQVRRMLAAVGHETLMLRRVALGPLRLGSLASGSHRPLTEEEIAALSHISANPFDSDITN